MRWGDWGPRRLGLSLALFGSLLAGSFAIVACTRANLDAIIAGPGADAGGRDAERDAPVEDVGRDTGGIDLGRDVGGVDVGRDAAPDEMPAVDTSDAAPVCPTNALKSGDSTLTIQVGGVARTYLLHVPSAYNGSKPVPLIVDFHYLNTSAARERTLSAYPAQTDSEGVIMAFPNGTAGPAGLAWNLGPCCVSGVDDVAFVRAMVAQIQTTACIDANRIYAVGSSLGGGMAYHVACHAADVFAAVAAASFDLLQQQSSDCNPPRPITVISFRGNADPLVPYGGGSSNTVPGMPVTFLGAQGTFQAWAAIDRCTDSASPEDDNGCASHTACGEDSEVILCTKQGGGQETGNASLAWQVLKRHTL
jgi:polyhydroxybutyrate depolymerase